MIQMVPQWQIVSIEVDDAEIRIELHVKPKFEEVGTNNKQIHKSQ